MKTKINRFISRLLVTIMFLLLASCDKDFLDLKNPNAISADNFFQTTNDFKVAVNTLYRSAAGIRSFYAQQLRGDDTRITEGAFESVVLYASYLTNAQNDPSAELYSNLYKIIFRANYILYYADGFDWTGNEDLKASISAETYFFRGLAYYYLAFNFGWVPVVTRPALSPEEFNPAKAATIDEVYDQAIADLLQAKEGLPTTQTDKGRATKGAATGFLGQLYLYRAGYLGQNNYYAFAAAEFKEVQDLQIYDLVPAYEDNFTAANENNVESLFELQLKYDASLGTPTQTRNSNSVPGIAFEIISAPSEWLMEQMAMEKTIDNNYDPRYLQTTYFNDGLPLFGVPFNQLGDGLILEGGVVVGSKPDGSSTTEGGWWRKYLNVNLPYEPVMAGGASENNERILRYADILLMYAEAKVKSTPADLTDAIAAVNKVRDRANLPLKTYADANDLMDEIMHQRLMEFAYENTRYFDLIRWGLLGEAIQDHGTDAQKENYIPERHKYFPLPPAEIMNNKNLVQNEAWE
jgi:starch-binding outer membrane protein, SusD/RagB family